MTESCGPRYLWNLKLDSWEEASRELEASCPPDKGAPPALAVDVSTELTGRSFDALCKVATKVASSILTVTGECSCAASSAVVGVLVSSAPCLVVLQDAYLTSQQQTLLPREMRSNTSYALAWILGGIERALASSA